MHSHLVQQNVLFDTNFYSFLPPVNYDKLVNYQEYFWSPEGPKTIKVNGSQSTPINILKDILGKDNVKLLGVDWDTVLVRLIVKFPGHGMAWHCDSLDSYVLKFSVDDPSKVKRYWFSIDDWYDGHVFQVSKTVLNNWTKGAAYDIPFGIGHASSNFGYRPMYSVSFTGVLDS